MNTKKRALALILALLLAASLLPAGALAGEEEPDLPEADGVVDTAFPETDPVGSAAPEAAAPSEEPAPAEESGETPAVPAETPEETAPSGEPVPASEESEEPLPEEPVPAPKEPTEDPAEPAIPASDGASLPDSLYLRQEQSGWCTLASCTMMLRARLYLSGSDSWSSVTQSGIYSTAWLPGAGVYFNWTWRSGGSYISVSHATINGISVGGLKALLDKHPEGIALYLYEHPHAIFVSDYEETPYGTVFYGADPARGYAPERKPIGSTWLGQNYGGQSGILSKADAYWYVSSYSIAATRWCTVRFDANGGSCGEESRSVKAGSSLGALPTPTRKGWVFDGWYTESGKKLTSSSSISESVTLYAQWYAVRGTISFSESPLTIRLYEGKTTASLTVTGTGQINRVNLDFKLDPDADGKLHAAWNGAGDGRSRTMTIRAEETAGGTCHMEFYMYDADTGALVNQQRLAVNIINENLYLELYQTSVTFAAGEQAVETVAILYGGTDGDLPEGYQVRILNDRPDAVSYTLEDFDGFTRPLVIRPADGYAGPSPNLSDRAELTIQLLDGAGICSETTVTVRILPVSGECGGDGSSVLWKLENGTLSFSVDPEHADEGFDMWNFESDWTPWSGWADEIMRVEIGPGVTRIGSCAFYGCIALRYIDIADSVTEIGQRAFQGCISLQSVSVPGSVSFIGEDAFKGCLEMTELAIHEGTSFLSLGALDGCSALTTLYVPASIKDLQLSAAPALSDLYYGGTRSQWTALDQTCALTATLSDRTTVHVADDRTVADAALILAGEPIDINGDNETNTADAAALLRQLVGREDQGGGMG